MARATGTIPNLLGGISQQPDYLRLPTQASDLLNVFPDVADGLLRRPPLHHLGSLSGAQVTTPPLVHWIDDGTDQYVLLLSNLALNMYRVHPTLGVQPVTISTPNGVSYLACSDPGLELRALTVQDYTFIVNTNITVTTSDSGVTFLQDKGIVWCRVAAPSTVYNVTVRVGGTPYVGTYTSGATTSTATIITNLQASLAAAAGSALVLSSDSSMMSVVRNGGGVIDSITVTDGYGNQSLLAIHGTMSSASLLPPRVYLQDAWQTPVKINPNLGSGGNSYYVLYDSGIHAWREYAGDGTKSGLVASTMPHTLVKTSALTFTFGRPTWNVRLCGDQNSVPPPSFVGRKIQDVFLHRDRLGFLAGDALVTTRTGQYFNFWPQTATQVLDDDPIDIVASTTDVVDLRYAVPFDKTLLLCASSAQYVLSSPETLTPSTASIDKSTEFPMDPLVRPVLSGPNVYFVHKKDPYYSIYEYYVDGVTATNQRADASAHVPRLMREVNNATYPTLSQLADRDTVVLRTSTVLYAYKTTWQGSEKVQSAWARIEPKDGASIFIAGCGVMGTGSKLYVAHRDPSKGLSEPWHLGVMDFAANPAEEVYLDHRTFLTGGVYDSGADVTRYTYPGVSYASSPEPLRASLGGELVIPVIDSANVLKVPGNTTALQAAIGYSYESSITLSKQYVRDEKGAPLAEYSLTVGHMEVFYKDTCTFHVDVTPKGRGTYTRAFNALNYGGPELLGQRQVDPLGSYRFPVGTDGRTAVIKLRNSSALPSSWLTIAWSGDYTPKR